MSGRNSRKGSFTKRDSRTSVLEVIYPEFDKIVLNVGGVRHETLVKTLARCPDTRLGELASRHQELGANEYFFDRNPEVFNAVIDYYRSGELHIPMDVCGVVIQRELQYWNLKETLIHPCCWAHYCSTVDKVEALESLNRVPLQEQKEQENMRRFRGVAKVRLTIWRLMCRPNSSKYAKIYSIMSMMFVITAITGCCLETIPSLQDVEQTRRYSLSCRGANASHPRSDEDIRLLQQPIFSLHVLDYLCNAFFSVELLIRLIVAPRPLTFIKSPITIIDTVAILPFYLMILIELIYKDACQRGKRAFFVKIVFVLRIVRIFRVFQMLAYFKPLKILLRSLRDSVYELLILLVFVLICMLVFATLAFYAEIEYRDSSFTTIPIGLWWALVTITTVGYGDVYPHTIGGYIVGGACSLCGTVIMALTIPILSNNFTLYYTHARTRERANVKEKLRESENQRNEQSEGTKKSILDDGSVIFNRPKAQKLSSHAEIEEELTFHRSSIVRSRDDLSQEKHILVGEGEIGSLQSRSQEDVAHGSKNLELEHKSAPDLATEGNVRRSSDTPYT